METVIRILGNYKKSIIKKIRYIKDINIYSFDFLKNEDVEIDVITKENAFYDAFEFLLDMINLIDPDCDTEDQEQFKRCCLKMGVKVNKNGEPHFKSLIKFLETHSTVKHIFL